MALGIMRSPRRYYDGFTLMGGYAVSATDLQQTIAQYHLAEKGNGDASYSWF
jgi:hypothetical protein